MFLGRIGIGAGLAFFFLGEKKAGILSSGGTGVLCPCCSEALVDLALVDLGGM